MADKVRVAIVELPATLAYRIEQDTSSGTLHKRYRDEFGRFRLVDERCNRDASGGYVVIGEAEALSNHRCAWDWPGDDAEDDVS